jgi:hypothetical protein
VVRGYFAYHVDSKLTPVGFGSRFERGHAALETDLRRRGQSATERLRCNA